jgi:hypothetical protein
VVHVKRSTLEFGLVVAIISFARIPKYSKQLCKDEFASHFVQEDDGLLRGVTASAFYTIGILRLNRKHLVTARKLLQKVGLRINDRELTSTLTHLIAMI